MKQPNPSDLPIMAKFCKSCPFKPDEKGIAQDQELANKVTERTLFKAHQICHGTEGPKREWKFRCKGSFENNMVIYERLGFKHLIK